MIKRLGGRPAAAIRGAACAMAACAAVLLSLCAAVQAGRASAPAPGPEGAALAPRVGELYVFLYRPGPAWRAGAHMREQALAPHAGYIARLLAEGRLFAGGGFDDEGGLAIVIAADRAEAEAMLAADPAITSGVFVATLEHWRPRFRNDEPLPRQR